MQFSSAIGVEGEKQHEKWTNYQVFNILHNKASRGSSLELSAAWALETFNHMSAHLIKLKCTKNILFISKSKCPKTK